MPNYEQICNQITELGFDIKMLPSAEMKGLPEILRESEKIKGIARGLYKSRTGILVATNERVIFFDKGLIWGSRVEEFRYEKITSVEYATGLIGGDITIYAAGNATKIDMVPILYCKPFAEAVREIISAMSAPVAVKTGDELLTKLERLSALKTSGMLTEEEFNAAKAKLLNL